MSFVDTANAAMDTVEEMASARSLLGQLLQDSRLYKSSKSYAELLQFVTRLRCFAPFNAMLLHVQKPGLTHAASAKDWYDRFGRTVKENARPLLILWPFGPVALVYDLQDTEGKELPSGAFAFPARGPMTSADTNRMRGRMAAHHISSAYFDGGDAKAGAIRFTGMTGGERSSRRYSMQINSNHSYPTQFVTIAHELGHLFLGHLGKDEKLRIPERSYPGKDQSELEAEAVACIVAARNGVDSESERYLASFVNKDTNVDALDLYGVMRSAGQIETLLELTPRGFAPRFRNPPA